MSSADRPRSVSDDQALARLADGLGRALRARGLVLAVAESCTGGWIAKLLTDIPGASDWFDSGYATYSNRAKTAALGVPADLLAIEGAVSEACVRAMTAGLGRITGCRAAIAVSGIAGPGGGSPAKPVGLVYLGFALEDRDWAVELHLAGDRDTIRRQAVAAALAELTAALSR